METIVPPSMSTYMEVLDVILSFAHGEIVYVALEPAQLEVLLGQQTFFPDRVGDHAHLRDSFLRLRSSAKEVVRAIGLGDPHPVRVQKWGGGPGNVAFPPPPKPVHVSVFPSRIAAPPPLPFPCSLFCGVSAVHVHRLFAGMLLAWMAANVAGEGRKMGWGRPPKM